MTVREKSGISVRLTAPCAHNAVGRVRRISDPRGWSALCLLAVFSATALGADQDSWNIRILPATKLVLAQAPPAKPAPQPYEPATKAAPGPAPPAGELRILPGRPHAAGARGPSYADVYRSIPFSRAEYVANPAYRNETALGLMLNQMPYPSNHPAVPQYGYVTPYQFDHTFGVPASSNLFYPMPEVL
jgi:hypothetical protein